MSGSTIRLSYVELAERLMVSKEAAKSRVRRAGWKRTLDNSGVARFNVPSDIFDTPYRHDIETPGNKGKDTGETLAAIEALSVALERSETARAKAETQAHALSEQVGRLKAEQDATQAEIEELRRVLVTETPPTQRRRWWLF